MSSGLNEFVQRRIRYLDVAAEVSAKTGIRVEEIVGYSKKRRIFAARHGFWRLLCIRGWEPAQIARVAGVDPTAVTKALATHHCLYCGKLLSEVPANGCAECEVLEEAS